MTDDTTPSPELDPPADAPSVWRPIPRLPATLEDKW